MALSQKCQPKIIISLKNYVNPPVIEDPFTLSAVFSPLYNAMTDSNDEEKKDKEKEEEEGLTYQFQNKCNIQ